MIEQTPQLAIGKDYIFLPNNRTYRYIGKIGTFEEHTFIRQIEVTFGGKGRAIEMQRITNESGLHQDAERPDAFSGRGPTDYFHEDGRYSGKYEQDKFKELSAMLSESTGGNR